MFNIGFGELVVIGVIALIFIGPQQLPEVARTIGRMLNELRRATDDLRGGFTEDVRKSIYDTRATTPTPSPEARPEPAAPPAPRASDPPSPDVQA